MYLADRAEEDADLEFPWSVGLGLAWRPTDAWTASADVTWTDWSDFRFRQNGFETNPLTYRPHEQDQCDDTYTYRFGLEYLVIKPRYVVPLRCGLGVDPGPSVDQVDEYYTASLGSGMQYGRYAVDIAYELRWGNGVNRATLAGAGARGLRGGLRGPAWAPAPPMPPEHCWRPYARGAS